ncbi:MAG: GNAT family N-acetyltransferase [Aeromicrobium sp.]|uniref:GNAT family N-acetyltransferase n=1 Tax=Aeromicrobium sp. TaxID=1871063 RepID=UPI0039E30699
MPNRPAGLVSLVAVDEAILEQLVHVAITDAAPDEVTPPLGDGWTQDRVAWLRAYHRDRRSGLAESDEETAAIEMEGRVVGATRLHRLTSPTDDMECGIWLARSARGSGVGAAAFRLLRARAVAVGAKRLVVRTTAGNFPALAILRYEGALVRMGDDGAVYAELLLDAP